MVEDHGTQGTQFIQNYEFFIKIESNLAIIKVVHLIMNNQMNNHLMKFFESHSIQSDKHHDFNKQRSYESQLILTIQDLAAGLNSKSQIDPILLDFSKAFDKIPHERLAAKLHHYGVCGNTLSWIKGFLANSKQRPAGNIRWSQIQLSTNIISCTSGDSTWPTVVPGLHKRPVV